MTDGGTPEYHGLWAASGLFLCEADFVRTRGPFLHCDPAHFCYRRSTAVAERNRGDEARDGSTPARSREAGTGEDSRIVVLQHELQ